MIIDFSRADPPEYNLKSIIYLEGTNSNIDDVVDLDLFDENNLNINLEEDINNLYEKIMLLFSKIYNLITFKDFDNKRKCYEGCNIL